MSIIILLCQIIREGYRWRKKSVHYQKGAIACGFAARCHLSMTPRSWLLLFFFSFPHPDAAANRKSDASRQIDYRRPAKLCIRFILSYVAVARFDARSKATRPIFILIFYLDQLLMQMQKQQYCRALPLSKRTRARQLGWRFEIRENPCSCADSRPTDWADDTRRQTHFRSLFGVRGYSDIGRCKSQQHFRLVKIFKHLFYLQTLILRCMVLFWFDDLRSRTTLLWALPNDQKAVPYTTEWPTSDSL